MSQFNLTKQSDENERQYIWRICSAKDEGILDLNWQEVADLLNKELHGDSELCYGESVYRKSYSTAKAYYKDVFSKQETPSIIRQLEDRKLELAKESRRVQDQRREYRKYLTQDARLEHLEHTIGEAAYGVGAHLPLLSPCSVKREAGNSEAVLFLADWHYGMTTDNIWNQYNTQICADRARELVEKTIVYLQRHKTKTLHIALLGDACAGAIHVGTRVESEEVVCEQIIHVSELIAECVAALAPYVENAVIYSTYGNHCRTIQNKHDSIHRDNMERLIAWWLRERLRDLPNVAVVEQDELGELIHIQVCNRNLIASHGDLERLNSMGLTFHALFAQKYGLDVHYVVMADKHHLEHTEKLGVDAMIVPAMCGTDEYAHNKRLYSDPAQVLMMFTPDNGRECVYHIKFSK